MTRGDQGRQDTVKAIVGNGGAVFYYYTRRQTKGLYETCTVSIRMRDAMTSSDNNS